MNSSNAGLDKPPDKRPNILLRLLGPGLVTGAADAGRDGRDLPGQDQSAAQIRTRLSLMRVAAMHYHIDPVESAFEEVPIGLELKRVRHDARGVREHAILGDNGIPFDATRTGHGNHFPTWHKLAEGWLKLAESADEAVARQCN